MRLLPLLALALLLLGRPASAEEPQPPPRPAAIDGAIERGVAWLLEEQKPPGHYGDAGKTALAAFALLHAGVREDQPDREGKRLAKALRWLDRSGPGRSKGKRLEPKVQTYDLAVYLMLLRLRGRSVDRERMQRLAEILWKRQAANGQWWYDGKGAPHIDTGDNSNTQFAMLALGHAQAAGLTVPRTTWLRAQRWWIGSAGKDGGFGYASGGSPKSASTGSMTAAGIACLALANAALPVDPRPAGPSQAPTRADEVLAKALAYLTKHFSVTRNHGPSIDRKNQRQRKTGRGWLHYYLWSVERALVLAEKPTLGEHHWYAQGAHRLLATQAKDGSWRQEAPLYATAFALLFLTRAADPPRVFTPSSGAKRRPVLPTGPVTGEAPKPTPERPDPAAPPAADVPDSLPAGSPATWLTEALPVGELSRRCRLFGVASLPPLVRALDAKDPVIRRRAWEALGELLPADRIRGADRHPLARGRLALWLRLHGPDLVVQVGRFAEPSGHRRK
ncbi:MAG: terpene cyclase/mutase family protein [Planctomycetota bacterium]|nr:terpene cyclase/mutase family protein [Planctomycetota bacterium]